jgi:hypothetical protein
MGKILQSTCLKPQYPLRRQLLVAFGSIAFLTTAIAIVLAAGAANSAGLIMQEEGLKTLEAQVIKNIRYSTSYVNDLVSRRLANLEGLASLQIEIVRDRIVGYPDRGWETDSHIAFFDLESNSTAYPIRAAPLPQDWNVTPSVTSPADAREHLQEREHWIDLFNTTGVAFSTSSAMYRFQGNCDPNETDPLSIKYYPNCTKANNNVRTGGVVHPVSTNEKLAEKAADIGYLFKPLWESHPEIVTLGVGFHNSGAGSYLAFPSYTVDGTASYISSGCDWMAEINPFTDEPFATPEEISRCHPNGTKVDERNYNPMERDWCADQALNPSEVRSFGPFRSSSDNLWLIAVGKAIFDRM